MKIKSFIKNKTAIGWKFASVNHSFYKRHKLIYNNGEFRKKRLTDSEKKEYHNYWKVISPIVNTKTVEISKTLSGKFDKRIIPEEFYALYFEPKFNNDSSALFLENKSIYNKWFSKGFFPEDYFHKIDNIYYSKDLKIIEDIERFISNIEEIEFPVVVKPSKNSYGGENIYFLNSKSEIVDTIKNHSDLVVQEKIKQSELINKFNQNSVNTVRVCLYKDVNGSVNILNSSIRMGKDGSLDNETAGGIVCNIKTNGMLNKYAVDKYAVKYFEHPNSGYVFENKKFPLYDELQKVSKEIAREIIGVQIISLDMALDSNNSWRCIELNLFGQTIRFAQYAGEPFFGELTDEVRELVSTNCNEK